jgi:long-chain acyl-CoA synthetase
LSKEWQKYYDEGVPLHLEYPEKTIYEFFEEAVTASPNRPATFFFGKKTTYGQLGKQVDQFASALASLGVSTGARVALILPNLPGYAVAHFAAMKLGAILVPTNPLYVERELELQLNDSGVEIVVCLDRLHPRLNAIISNTSVKHVVYMGVQDFLPFPLKVGYLIKNRGQAPVEPGENIYFYSDLLKKCFPVLHTHPTNPDDVAVLLYTGGTTGISKGAVLTHRNLVSNVLQTGRWMGVSGEPREIILSVLPFFHSYGMTTSLHLGILSRATLVLLPRFDLPDVVKRIKKHRPTIFCGVPSMYNSVTRFPGIVPDDINSIRLCVSGGAALPEDVQIRFEKMTGGRLVEGYGLSETSPVAIVNPLYGKRKVGSIGIPISDTEARIVDPDTRTELEVGEVGELALRGPQIMREYWNMPEETDQVFADGWLLTGDLATQDEDGFVSIVDRAKDIIISAGMNIYPREIEEVLMTHPSILEVAVLGVPSRVREEVVKSFIVLLEDAELSKMDVVEFCIGKLAKHKIPKQIEFRSELPKSSIGKILKRVLVDEEREKVDARSRGRNPS